LTFSVFQDNWSIPYKREESLGRCLVAATNLARENLMEADDNCKKFVDKVMPEAFK
jgi:ubiquitin carboxyl-terminal hydrolase 9/24